MCYFSNVLQYPQATVDSICHALNDPKLGRVDFIAGTGISGTLALMPVSMQSGIPCGAVRKVLDTEKGSIDGGSHSCTMVETFLPVGYGIRRYVIIDDNIESGETIRRIKQAMISECGDCECVGIILYQDYRPIGMHLGVPVTSLWGDIIELDALRLIEQLGV